MEWAEGAPFFGEVRGLMCHSSTGDRASLPARCCPSPSSYGSAGAGRAAFIPRFLLQPK